MKLKDVKEVLEFFIENDIRIKEAVVYMFKNSPCDVGLKCDGQCNQGDAYFRCWSRCLTLEENKDKLENVI